MCERAGDRANGQAGEGAAGAWVGDRRADEERRGQRVGGRASGPCGLFFSLRIPMRFFQNQDLKEVFGKNLIENQEPNQEHHQNSRTSSKTSSKIEILGKTSLRFSLRFSMRKNSN